MNRRTSLAEQLSAVRAVRTANVPRSRYLMQSFLATADRGAANREKARTLVLDWAREKWPGDMIPKAAYQGIAFEHDQPGLRIATAVNEDGSLWAFRSEHLGHGLTEMQTWVTEAVVADLGPVDAVGVRNSCSTIGQDQVATNSPRFLRYFVADVGLRDAGRPVGAEPILVATREQLMEHVLFLQDRNRKLPVVVVSEREEGALSFNVAAFARDVQGLAHVVTMPAEQTFWVSDTIGKALSVFNGATRVYQPGFSLDDDPYRHPLYFAQRVLDWRDAAGQGSAAFAKSLARLIHLGSVATPEQIDELPSYFSIRRAFLDKPNKTAREENELLRMELAEMTARAADWQALAAERDGNAEAADAELRALRSQNHTLTFELQRLRSLPAAAAPAVRPNSYDEMARWVESELSDALLLHPRAVNALKKARFENVAMVYDALDLLARQYRALRMCDGETERAAASAAFAKRLGEIGLEYSAAQVAPQILGRYPQLYRVPYRVGQNTHQALGPHLKWGSTKDDRFCLRIYFFWDDDREIVVIGHLPAHLDNAAT